MRTKINLLALAAVCTIVVFVSCKKEDPAPTKTEMLCDKNWKLTAATIDPPYYIGGTYITNFYAQMQDCQKDDIYKYLKEGVSIKTENSKCDPSDPATESGTWEFRNNETELWEDGEYSKLEELTNTKLRVTIPIDTINNIVYYMTGTFEAQ